MAEQAQKVIAVNGFAEVIKVEHGKVEDVALDVKVGVRGGEALMFRTRRWSQVDAIVSEWMGTLLIFEFMVESGK